jgi:hypothetical protein
MVTERTQSGILMGEIAERVLELCDAQGEARTQRWLLRMAAMASDPQCPRALWHYLRFATGDLSALTDSHAMLGAQMARSKQAEHKEHRHALEVIARHFPEVARVLRELKP